MDITGFYGSQNTPCTVFAYTLFSGLTWYCVEGSVNVNATYSDIANGVDVELIDDVDMFTASTPIESIEQLENEVNS